jgi:hypothetical protein
MVQTNQTSSLLEGKVLTDEPRRWGVTLVAPLLFSFPYFVHLARSQFLVTFLTRTCFLSSRRNLSRNALRELADRAFDHLSQLASLSLASNEISAIGDSAFGALTSLVTL